MLVQDTVHGTSCIPDSTGRVLLLAKLLRRPSTLHSPRSAVHLYCHPRPEVVRADAGSKGRQAMPPGCAPRLQGKVAGCPPVTGGRGLACKMRVHSPASLSAADVCSVGRLQCGQRLGTCSSNLECQAKAVAACSQFLTMPGVHPRRSMMALALLLRRLLSGQESL